MKRLARIVALAALNPILVAGVAQAALRLGNDKPNTFRGTLGDNKGQDVFFGLGAGDTLVGTSAADQLAGGSDPDRLEGNDGNDNLDGGARGEQDLHGKQLRLRLRQGWRQGRGQLQRPGQLQDRQTVSPAGLC